ncbi:MAG TPA: sugar transferase [Bacillus bacterium]|nr:sugar transferase [Bacillus sp. (in: firmicutes)]
MHIVERRRKVIILAVDLFLVFFAYIIAFIIRYDNIPERNWESFISLIPWILLITLFFLAIYDLYNLNRKGKWDIIRNVIVASTFMMFLTMSVSFLFREFALPRTVIIIAFLIETILLVTWKMLFKKVTEQKFEGSVLLISDDLYEKEKVIEQIKSTLGRAVKIIEIGVHNSSNRINSLIESVDYVFVGASVSGTIRSDYIYHSIKNGKIVFVIPDLYDLMLSKSSITSVGDTMVMAVKPFGLLWDQLLSKRIYDIIFSLFILVLLSPLFLFISLLIKLEDPKSPVLYKQKRLGRANNEFTIYKFRSMVNGAEKLTGPTLATENDPRITKIGKFIRKTRIDELPQFWNVLKGDMSVVGPRPEREYFINQYMQDHHYYGYRTTVKPGITGYAQIMGKYTTDVEDKLRFDLYYIRNYSFWLDIIIQLRTIIVLLDKTNAEGKKDIQQTKKNKKDVPMNF